MARTRLLKPDFFHDEDLAELPFEARLLFAGLWTIADRDGRLEDRPKRIKAQVFPYDDLNVDYLLQRLASSGFISRYDVDALAVIQIRTFAKHQNPHHREPESVLPKNLSKIEKPRLVQGKALPNSGTASTLPQPSRAVFDTVSDTDAVSDPVSDTESDPVSDAVAVQGRSLPSRIGKQRPLMEYPRLSVFPWMVDDLLNMLGPHSITFDLDAFLLRLDTSNTVLPAQRWPWLRQQVEAECRRRGLMDAPAPTNKRIAGLMAGGEAFLRRVAESEAR